MTYLKITTFLNKYEVLKRRAIAKELFWKITKIPTHGSAVQDYVIWFIINGLAIIHQVLYN